MNKVSWLELEKLGLDEQSFEDCEYVMNNIKQMHNEAFEIFERILDGENPKTELRNFIQLCSMLNNEMENATKIIDDILKFADKAVKKE